MSASHPSILIVENDTIDIMLFKRVVKDIEYPHPVEFSSDGTKALEYLQNPKREIPWLILLDLNIPRMSGLELLTCIKKDNRLKWIPVVVISSSENPDDILACMNQGACGYLMKDFEYEAFKYSVSAALKYWARSRTPVRNYTIEF